MFQTRRNAALCFAPVPGRRAPAAVFFLLVKENDLLFLM